MSLNKALARYPSLYTSYCHINNSLQQLVDCLLNKNTLYVKDRCFTSILFLSQLYFNKAESFLGENTGLNNIFNEVLNWIPTDK
ncbi:Transposase [Nostoc sp. DSM 114160]